MAIKNLIANGIGFSPMGYVITDGIGDLSAGSTVLQSWWVSEQLRRISERKAVEIEEAIFTGSVHLPPLSVRIVLGVDNSAVEDEEKLMEAL